MALPPTFKVDIFSDVGWKTNQFALIAEASTYDEMKVAITNNVKGKNKKGKAKCLPFFMAAAEFFRCKQAFAFDLPIAKYSAAGCFRTSDDL